MVVSRLGGGEGSHQDNHPEEGEGDEYEHDPDPPGARLRLALQPRALPAQVNHVTVRHRVGGVQGLERKYAQDLLKD